MTITQDQQKLLSRLAVTQRWASIGGAIFVLMGFAYGSWAVLRYDPFSDPRDDPGWDKPVAQLAFIYERFQIPLERIQPESELESLLLEVLQDGMRFSAGTELLMMRLFLATLSVLLGFVMWTVVIERRRLLAIIQRLQA